MHSGRGGSGGVSLWLEAAGDKEASMVVVAVTRALQ
jgi:hypothetical protein